MNKRFWVGVDLSKKDFWGAVASNSTAVSDWAKLPARSFPFSDQGVAAFVSWVEGFVDKDALEGICIESTGRLGWQWMGLLDGALGAVSMENPARTKSFRDGIKSYALLDAFALQLTCQR